MPVAHTQLTIMLLHPELADSRDPDAKQVIAYGSEAKWLALLGRIEADLQTAVKRGNAYLAAASLDEPDVDYLALAADGAFIAYGRLDSGAGGKFPAALLAALSPEIQARHRWALTLRDKFVGHTVNALSQSIAIAGISDDLTLSYVFALSMRAVPTVHDMTDLVSLAETVRTALEPMMEAARTSAEEALAKKAAKLVDNPQPQFDLVEREGFDYQSTAGELRGKFGVPVLTSKEKDSPPKPRS